MYLHNNAHKRSTNKREMNYSKLQTTTLIICKQHLVPGALFLLTFGMTLFPPLTSIHTSKTVLC